MKTVLICGLGNPGREYEKTRHNVGFLVVDKILRDMSDSSDFHSESNFYSFIAETIVKDTKFIFAKPKTFMNNSGKAIKSIKDYYKISDEDVLIAHDDLDIILGSYKISFGSQSAGHHGIDSIIEHLGHKNFWRARIGIISKSYLETKSAIKDKSARHAFTSSYVLSEFSDTEINIIIEATTEPIIKWIKQRYLQQ